MNKKAPLFIVVSFLLFLTLVVSVASAQCQKNQECDDGNSCTVDICMNGSCINQPITTCVSGDGCCPEGCTRAMDSDCRGPGWTNCTTNADCDDGNLCTIDECVDGSCSHTQVMCDDKDPCTVDTCINGNCTHMQITSCISRDMCCPEGCTLEVDKDCPPEEENQPPRAFISLRGGCYANQGCTFDASDSYDPEGKITRYIIDFGDGSSYEGTSAPAILTHVYNSSGGYTITLVVIDNDGLNDSFILPIYVKSNVTWTYDLRLENVSCPSRGFVGERYEIPVVVYQKVSTESPIMPGRYKVALYDNGTLVWMTVVSNHKPNTYKTSYVRWYPLFPGQHVLTVVVDPFNDITETNERNNKIPEPCTVLVGTSENLPPKVKVISPNGGEELRGIKEIRWEAHDPDGEILDNVEIYYQPCRIECPSTNVTLTSESVGLPCREACGPSIPITKHAKNTGSYLWDTTQVPNGRYRVKVAVTDGELWASDTSDRSFSVVNKEEHIVFEECDNGIGYSIGDPNYSADPNYCKSGLSDCCGLYQVAHVHDFRAPVKGPVTLHVTVVPGFRDGCESNVTIYKSIDNQDWKEIKRMNVISTQVGGMTRYPDSWKRYSIEIPNVTDFRYIKVEVPNCYNDYSSVRIGTKPGPRPCEVIKTGQIRRLATEQCAIVADYKKMKLTLKGAKSSYEAGMNGSALFIVELGERKEKAELHVGESKDVFGANIKLLAVGRGSKSWAAFVVKVKGSEVLVRLDKPFNLQEGQKARLVDYRVLEMRLNSIRKVPVVVRNLTSGTKEVPGRIKLVASITVWPTFERPIIVQEKPNITTTRERIATRPMGARRIPVTGMVTSSSLATEETPEQAARVVRIISPIKRYTENITRSIEVEKIKERFYRRYTMTKGESINVFGVRITLRDINEKYATFVITKEVPWISCQEVCQKEGYNFGTCSPQCRPDQVDLGTGFCPQVKQLKTTPKVPPAPTPIEPVMHCCCEKEVGGISFTIHKGWNLFSLPGQLENVNLSGECDTKDWRTFEYDKENKSFYPVKYPEIGKGYWVYATGTCHVSGSIKAPTLLDELEELTPGWNFVPVVPDMIGKNIEELGNCSIVSAYIYSTPERRWIRIKGPITERFYGKAILVKTKNICKLGGEIPFIPPPFPEEESGEAVEEVY